MRSAPSRLALALTAYATVTVLLRAAISVRTHIHAGPSPHSSVFVELALILAFGPIFTRLQVADRAEAIVRAREAGLGQARSR